MLPWCYGSMVDTHNTKPSIILAVNWKLLTFTSTFSSSASSILFSASIVPPPHFFFF